MLEGLADALSVDGPGEALGFASLAEEDIERSAEIADAVQDPPEDDGGMAIEDLDWLARLGMRQQAAEKRQRGWRTAESAEHARQSLAVKATRLARRHSSQRRSSNVCNLLACGTHFRMLRMRWASCLSEPPACSPQPRPRM